MDWHDLVKMKVTELRELAKEKTSLEGVSGLTKDKLVEAIAGELGIPRPHKVVEKGLGKRAIKAEVRALKVERDAAIAAGDRDALSRVRDRMRSRKRKLRRLAHVTH